MDCVLQRAFILDVIENICMLESPNPNPVLLWPTSYHLVGYMKLVIIMWMRYLYTYSIVLIIFVGYNLFL